MREDEIDNLVYDIYLKLGNPGSLFGAQKIAQTLKSKGYKISDTEVSASLKKIKEYNQFRIKNRSRFLPAHISQRFSNVSGPNIEFVGDTVHLKSSGFRGPFSFCQVRYTDCNYSY